MQCSLNSEAVLHSIMLFAVGMAINDAFIALTLLVGRQEEHLACKN